MGSGNKHQTLLSVRGYELDSYGHVNNAVYIQYLEQARWIFMKDKGLLERIFGEGYFMVVVDTHIRYVQEANLFDELIVETTLAEEKPYLVFRQKILNKKTGLTITKAIIKTIFVDKKRVPQDTPGFLSTFISEL